MRDGDDDDVELPPLGYDESRVREWLGARLGRPATLGEVRGVWARMCCAWSRRARRVRALQPGASERKVARVVRDSILAELTSDPEARILLTVAYAAVQIARGIFAENCVRSFGVRAQTAEWDRRRSERRVLLSYLDAKLGRSVYVADNYRLDPKLVCSLNTGSVSMARAWRVRLAASASTMAYDRAVRELRAEGGDALKEYSFLGRPEPGLPRGIWSPTREIAPLSDTSADTSVTVHPAAASSPVPIA